MTEHNTQNTQTRAQDMIQHIRLLDNALSMNLYHAAKTWLNHVLKDMEILEAEAEVLEVEAEVLEAEAEVLEVEQKFLEAEAEVMYWIGNNYDK